MIGCAMVARALLVRRNKGKLADMTGPGEDAIRAAFRTQADFCRASGSPLTATILTALADTLDHETRTGAAILGWSGDPMVDALKLRIAGGLNALARSGEDSALSALYAAREGDFVGQIGRVIRQWDDWLLAWLDRHNLAESNPIVVIGRVPLFFFLVHFWLAHLLTIPLAAIRYGRVSFLAHPLPSMGGAANLYPPGFGYSLPEVYLIWVAVVAITYPLCVWFARVKKRRRSWWLSYL